MCFPDQVMDISCACFDKFNDGLGRVINLDPLLASFHEQLLGHIWLTNENFGVVSFHVAYQLIVVVNDLLKLTQV